MVYNANFQNTSITSIDNIDIHPYDIKIYNLAGTQIESLTLADFKALEELWLPGTITALSFSNTPKLKTIYFDGSPAEWNKKLQDYGFSIPEGVTVVQLSPAKAILTVTDARGTIRREYDASPSEYRRLYRKDAFTER